MMRPRKWEYKFRYVDTPKSKKVGYIYVEDMFDLSIYFKILIGQVCRHCHESNFEQKKVTVKGISGFNL